MIFSSFLITFICYPSLIIYKPLPGASLTHLNEDPEFKHVRPADSINYHRIGWLSVINLGTFFVFQALGIFLRNSYREEVIFRERKRIWISILFAELACCSFTVGITLDPINSHQEDQGKFVRSQCEFTAGLVAMFILAFLHGFTMSHFLTRRPEMKDIPQSK